METRNYSFGFEHAIKKLIEKLLKLLKKGKHRDKLIKRIREELSLLENANSRFMNCLYSISEKLKMVFFLLICGMCIPIDFALLFNALSVICGHSQMLAALKIFVPLVLVVGEIGISHIAIEKQNAGEYLSWSYRNLQYFVILLLYAFAVAAIVYSVGGYDPNVDGGSYMGYVFGVIITQVVLLVPATLLHIWVIRNAGDVANAFAFFRFRFSRKKMLTKQYLFEKWQESCEEKVLSNVYLLVEKLESGKRSYEASVNHVVRTMPNGLIDVINRVMGRTIFDSNDSKDTKNGIYEP